MITPIRPTCIFVCGVASFFSLPSTSPGSAWQGTVSADVNDPANWDSNPAGQNIYFGIPGNAGGPAPFRATLSSNLAFGVVDIQVARGGGPAILNHTAGTAATGAGNWLDVGTDGGNGTYNLANTAATGGTLTGFGQGSGSIRAERIYVGGVEFGGGGGTGLFNINTTGTVDAVFRLIVGEQGTGVLNMDSGTLNIGNDLTVGFRTNGTNIGNGAFRMSGGIVNRTGGWTTFGRDGNSQGTFEMSGGVMNTVGETIVGLNGATGTFRISGGNYNVGGEMRVGMDNSATGVATVSGGTLNVNSWMTIGRNNSNGTLSISGTGTVNQGLTDTASALELTNFGAGGTGTLNLDGGTLHTNRILANGGAGATTIANLNGGTLKARQNETGFLAGLTRANVRDGGARIDTNSFNITIDQALEHSNVGGDAAVDGGLTKSGAGTLTLGGVNTYTGLTNVTTGKLMVLGSVKGDVSVASGATLGGNGSILGMVSVANGAIVAPGTSPGTMNTGAFNLLSGSNLVFELDTPGVVGSNVNDLISVTGNLVLDGTLQIQQLAGFGNGTYRLFNYTGSLTNNVLNLEPGFLASFPGSTISTSVGNQVNLTVVPEPTATLSVLTGLGMLLGRRRRAGR